MFTNSRKSAVFAALFVLSVFCAFPSAAQFRSEAFTQQYNSQESMAAAKKKNKKDTTDVLFSFKEYFGGLRHENTLKIGTSFAGSMVFVGGQQIYNGQNWKLPIVYGGIGAGLAGGIYFNSTGRNDVAKYFFIGAGVFYWGSLMDGVLNYKPSDFPHPGKATVLSIILPGLGQIYNNEWWKLPIYLGGMGFAIHLYSDFSANFDRYQRIYDEAIADPLSYSGPITAEQARYYRNTYRRWRDYSLFAVLGIYLLQIIDANVFAYMHNFDTDTNLSFNIEPTVISMDRPSGFSPAVPDAVGLKFGFSF